MIAEVKGSNQENKLIDEKPAKTDSPNKISENSLFSIKEYIAKIWEERRLSKQKQTLAEYREKYEDCEMQISDFREYIAKRCKKEPAVLELATKVPQDDLPVIFNPAIQDIERLLKRPDLTPEIRRNLEIHLKSLKLQPLQMKLKKSILGIPTEPNPYQIKAPNPLEKYLVDRQFYARARLLPYSDRKGTKTLERYELQMRSGQEQRQKARHKEFLKELETHAREFLDFHKKKLKTLKTRAQQVKSHLESIEKKEQHNKDKDERLRINALKKNNIAEYIKILDKEKNTRLREILDQTEKYLEQLGAKVMQQKQEAIEIANKNIAVNTDLNKGMPLSNSARFDEDSKEDNSRIGFDKEPKNNDQNEEKPSLIQGSREYYKITHTIKEEVTGDPKTLKGGQLKSYQLQGLQWLVSLYNNNLNGILADEMGLGKTIQTIALFCYLMETKGNDGPFLIVVPLSTLTNWVLEFDKWAPHIKKLIYKGDPGTRKELAQQMRYEKFNVVLTTYEYIMKDRNVLGRIIWQYIIVDEGHRMKNYKCKFALTLGQQYQSAHRLLLTGTPLQNNLSELWALLNFLLPKIFSSCDEFEKWFNRPFSKFGTEKNVPLNEEEQLLVINRLHEVLSPFLLRRMKKEVEQELPNKVEYVIKVDLSAWQKIYYDQLAMHGMLALDPSTGKIGSRSLMNTLMQLRKICNHPYLFLNFYSSDFLIGNIWKCSGKFELLDRILPKLIKKGHKILIFSQMTQLMDIMQIYFNIKGLKHLRLDGTTKADERGHWTHLFNSETSDYKIFLLSTRAGGLGLNLQAADTVIIFDSDFNPQMDLQAQDRAHRIGQKHEVRVYRLVTNTKVEEGILSKAAIKKNIDNVVIQAGLFNQKASDVDRKKRLEDLLKQDDKNNDDEDDAIPDDEQINELLARNSEEFEEYQKMDQERYINEAKEERIKEIMAKTNISVLPKNYNYRLMQQYEVPDWVTKLPTEEKKEIVTGKRVRKKVCYADDITERQWEKCIEEGRDPNEEIERIKEMREQRKRRKIEEGEDPENASQEVDNEDQIEQQIENIGVEAEPNGMVMRIKLPVTLEEGFGQGVREEDENEEFQENQQSENENESPINQVVRVRLNNPNGNQEMNEEIESEMSDENLSDSD